MTGIMIVARLGSTRLTQKHLIKTAGKSFIEWLAERYIFAFRREIEQGSMAVFIVTSSKEENKKFETVFANNPAVKIFYGADSNIPFRQWQCAIANGIDNIISIDGDDILCSTEAARQIRNKLLQHCDYVKTSGLALGMNVMGYKTAFLKSSLDNAQASKLETGWGRIFNEEKAEKISLGNYDVDKRLRLTLDYNEDSEFFKKVIESLREKLFETNDATLINHIIQGKYYQLNEKVNDIYWQNFDQQKRAETKS
jgi:spore coat polysaccharide biosynthesis protein SpsF (cytidylyltransferase family)